MQSFVVKKYSRGSQKKPLIVVVSKAVAKRAVDRNKTKRRIRAIIAPLLKQTDHDYVIICKKGILGLSFEELKNEITRKISNSQYPISNTILNSRN